MKYIRTKNGIYEYVGYDTECIIPSPIVKYKDKLTHCIERDIIKQADTIKDLVGDDDILYIHDLYPDAVLVVEGNIKPFGYQTAIKLKEWLKYTHIKFDLFIKDSEGNYIKRATTNDEGELELV